MATTKTATALKGSTTADKAVPAPVAAPMAAPLFTYAPYNPALAIGWPAKAASGATVRAFCAKVAQALAKAQPGGFTVAQYATALANAAALGTTYKLPASGFGLKGAPNATARQHANWFAHTGKFLVPAAAPAKVAKAKAAPAPVAAPAPAAPATTA